MKRIKWKHRREPSPTASHLWQPDYSSSLCGKVSLNAGTWEDGAVTPKCLYCLRIEAQCTAMLQKILGDDA